MTNNKLIITAAGATGTWDSGSSAYTGISGTVQSGRNGGTWTGNGITSSLASTGGSNLYTLGVAIVGDVKQISDSATATFAGQTVHGSDTIVMYTYGGDANLDGKLNIDDYGIIDGNIGLQGAPIDTSGIIAGVVGVPEPASLGLIALAGAGLLSRRRRRG